MRATGPVVTLSVAFAVVGCQHGATAAKSAAPIGSSAGSAVPSSAAPLPSSAEAPAAPEAAAPAATADLAGEAADFGPRQGDVLAVIGVAHDDVLHLRAQPGADQPVIGRIPPLADDLIARGQTRHLGRSFWTKVEHGGTVGWAHLGYIGYIGDTTDETAAVVQALGERPVAETMADLGLIVAHHLAAGAPNSHIVLTVAPSVGDLGEVTYDVIDLGDDSVRGLRAHVFGMPADGRFSLRSVEVTRLCGRGVTEDRLCI